MNGLLLGGESLRNKGWIEEVAKKFQPLFDEIKIHYYRHWQTGEKGIDLAYEQQSLKKTAAGLGDYVVFAKSAGAVLSIKVVAEGGIAPQKAVFVGTALGMVENLGLPLADWLKAIDIPKLFIHNAEDPVASFTELKTYVEASGARNFQLVESPGDTHDYLDFAKLKSLAREFING